MAPERERKEHERNPRDPGRRVMGGEGSGRKPGFKSPTSKGVPYDKNPVWQSADPSAVDPGTNARVLAFGRGLMAMGPLDLSDPEAVEGRFYDYLDLCERHGLRPMVTAMSNAFGLSRQELWGLATDNPKYARFRGGSVTPTCRDILRKGYNFVATAWETYLVEEKGNPVKWLFLGKNYFGMRDQTEQVQVKIDASRQLASPEEVARKYAGMVGRPREAREPVDGAYELPPGGPPEG